MSSTGYANESGCGRVVGDDLSHGPTSPQICAGFVDPDYDGGQTDIRDLRPIDREGATGSPLQGWVYPWPEGRPAQRFNAYTVRKYGQWCADDFTGAHGLIARAGASQQQKKGGQIPWDAPQRRTLRSEPRGPWDAGTAR